MSGWADMTHGAFRLRVLPGGHFYLRSEEPTLLADLSNMLDAVKSGTAIASCGCDSMDNSFRCCRE
jgi:pyochelin biosynthetic protein PchC